MGMGILVGEKTENDIGFVCESNSGEFISIPHVEIRDCGH